MPIPTDVTLEQTFEVVDPQDLAPPGSNALAYVEEGLTQLTINQQIHTVTFTVAKATAQYLFDEAFIQNTADDPILNLEFNISAHDANGFQIVTSGLPITGNYYLRWKVRIPTSTEVGVPIVAAGGGSGTVTAIATVPSGGITSTVTNASTTPSISIGVSDAGLTRAKTTYAKTNLSGGTALTLGTWYYDTLTAIRTFTFTGSPSATQPATILELTVSGGPWTITIPQSYPSGEVGSVTSRVLQNGNYVAVWNYTNGKYTLDDTFDKASQTGEVIVGLKALNLFSGSPTYDLGNATNVTGGLDTISSTRGETIYRGVAGWTGADPGASGTVWRSNGPGQDPSWQSTSGGGTPGGSDKMVQFNDLGAFGGDPGFTYDKTPNILSVPLGTSTANSVHLGGSLFDYFADGVSTHTNGTDDDLFYDTVPANTLSVDGAKLFFEYALTTVTHTTATAEIKVWFAGTAIYTTGALNYPSANGQVYIKGFIIRDGATSVRYSVSCGLINATLVNTTKAGKLTGITSASTNILKVTGAAASTNAAASDITAIAGQVSWGAQNLVGTATSGGGGGGGTSTLLTGLRSYYALEDLTDSANGQTLTNVNAVTFVAGKVNNCANFVSASSQKLSVNSNSFNQMGSTSFTVAMWLKFTTSAVQVPLVKGDVSTQGYSIYFSGADLSARVGRSNSFVSVTSASGFNDGAWHLAVLVADTATTLKLYVDNASQGTPTALPAGDTDNAIGLTIGDALNGTIDEVGFWNRALTLTEIGNLWNSGNGTTYPFTGL